MEGFNPPFLFFIFMVSTFQFGEVYSTIPGLVQGSVSNINFGTLGSPEIHPQSYPVPISQNSFEKYIFGSWGGTFTRIYGLKFWMNSGSYGTGEVIKFMGSVTPSQYATPVRTISTVATGSVPTSYPSNYNVAFITSTGTADLNGSLTGPGSSCFVVLQYQTTSLASPGTTNQKTFILEYIEE